MKHSGAAGVILVAGTPREAMMKTILRLIGLGGAAGGKEVKYRYIVLVNECGTAVYAVCEG